MDHRATRAKSLSNLGKSLPELVWRRLARLFHFTEIRADIAGEAANHRGALESPLDRFFVHFRDAGR
jgi:hypothetical protein